MSAIRVRPAEPGDRAAVEALHEREWGGRYVIAHGARYDLRTLPTLVAVDGAGAVDRARRLKPGIPLVGEAGIPLHDELVLERRLDVGVDE